MKQKDILVIAVVVIISSAFAFILSNKLIAAPKNRQEKVEVVEKVTADFQLPDEKYFNATSINPTKLIQIGDSGNTKPFNVQ